jgi:ribosomal-protein-alanine N-acetyltransferase
MIALLPRARAFVDEPTPSELDSLAEIHADGFAHGWSAEDLASLLAEANVFALVVRRQPAFGGRRIVGFVLVRIAADEAEILTIAVSRVRRGHGYGRLLMEEAMRRLYRERIGACFLEVDRSNDRAVGLYRALGFAAVGTRKGYYRETAGADGSALVMRLDLR